MAGAVITGGRGPRRELDSEINMVPMIDLMMVTISFLLITAVWTHLARVDASAIAPGQSGPAPPKSTLRLHVEMKEPERFVLHWNEGPTVVRSIEVLRASHAAAPLHFPELAASLKEEWRIEGVHKDAADRDQDELVLHTSDTTPYAAIIAAIDAAYDVQREARGGTRVRAFNVTFAVN